MDPRGEQFLSEVEKDHVALLYTSRAYLARNRVVSTKKLASDSCLFASAMFFAYIGFVIGSIKALAAGVRLRSGELIDFGLAVRCDETTMSVALVDDSTTCGVPGLQNLPLEDLVKDPKFKKSSR